MDVFAHFLWTSGLFWKSKKHWLIGLFGVLPDLLSFGVYLVIRLFTGGPAFGRPNLATIPPYVHTLYNLTHSLVMWLLYAAIVYLLFRKYFILMLGWLLHIFLDVFTHTDAFFPTPVLWPLSNWHYEYGVSWGTPVFMLVNYSALTVLWVLIIVHTAKTQKPHKV